MTNYLLRRLLLLPVTLFAIVLVNFAILNLAPGDPVNMANLSVTGEATRSEDAGGGGDQQYLIFREHYGLTLPILLNAWPSLSKKSVHEALLKLSSRETMSVHDYHDFKVLWGDRARFVMPLILEESLDPTNSLQVRREAANLFIRGGTRQGYTGPSLSVEKRQENQKIAETNRLLSLQRVLENENPAKLEEKIQSLKNWFEQEIQVETFMWNGWEKVKLFFFETRFSRYLSRVLTLDFGTLRNDSNRTVISEVGKRIKYSLTLAFIPMILTFCLCQFFGMLMAVKQNQWIDTTLNITFLMLFAIPVFVVAPFLIEKLALHHTLPFSKIPIPYSGFHSPQEIYDGMTSWQRLGDVSIHLLLPLTAIMYGTLAVQARLSRTAFLEVLRQDYIRTVRAKGLPWSKILVKHVGRNGAITIVTSLAASLGVILGGSLIVETIFEINGFGKFFYEAILNRDYNVVLFSAFAGSLLTLIGYLIADIAYTVLDPRVNLKAL